MSLLTRLIGFDNIIVEVTLSQPHERTFADSFPLTTWAINPLVLGGTRINDAYEVLQIQGINAVRYPLDPDQQPYRSLSLEIHEDLRDSTYVLTLYGTMREVAYPMRISRMHLEHLPHHADRVRLVRDSIARTIQRYAHDVRQQMTSRRDTDAQRIREATLSADALRDTMDRLIQTLAGPSTPAASPVVRLFCFDDDDG